MKNNEIIKIPRFVKLLIISYIGITSIFLLTNSNSNANIGFHILYNVTLSVHTTLAVYGVISLLEDFRKGGYNYIIRKLRRLVGL